MNKIEQNFQVIDKNELDNKILKQYLKNRIQEYEERVDNADEDDWQGLVVLAALQGKLSRAEKNQNALSEEKLERIKGTIGMKTYRELEETKVQLMNTFNQLSDMNIDTSDAKNEIVKKINSVYRLQENRI